MYEQRLYDAVAMMVHIVFSFLRTLEDFTNHPDVVEEFFYLLARMLTYCPTVVMAQSPLLHSLVQFAAVGLQLQHVGANKGTLQFLDKMLSHGFKMRENDIHHITLRTFAPLEQVLSNEGPGLVSQLFHTVVSDLPSGPQVPEILWKLNLLCPEQLMQWLTSALAAASLPERAKTDFLNALNTTYERDDFRLVVGALQGACDRERRRLRDVTRRA
jgi:transportin-3